MRAIINSAFRFLPVQLLFLHFRKYQLLLVFWFVLLSTITGNFASVFGASSLFLAPEYQNTISFFSMFIIGGAMAVFIMAWHITTFIIHSHRIPFLGATRHSFLKYCINNAILPFSFLIFYTIMIVKYQVNNEHAHLWQILRFQIGFYLGIILIIIISFSYFFRVDRDLLKVVLSRITNPSRIKNIIPYDTLDIDIDIVKADTYLTGRLKIRKCAELEPYAHRVLQTVLRKHHRNAITATIFALLVLLLSGIFMDDTRLRIPAAAGFLLLFSVIMGAVGAMKYFLRSWEIIGWLMIILFVSGLVKYKIFDLRSRGYGLDYHIAEGNKPVYDYNNLQKIFTNEQYGKDKQTEEKRLDIWRNKNASANDKAPPLIIIAVSGGGSRASYWTFRTLQYLDSITNGKLYKSTVMMTGASGGMIGAAYWREIQDAYYQKKITTPYQQVYQENVGKDLLNAIIFSFASVDLISPFNKISIAGYSYKKDRGYAMEQEMIRNSEGLLDRKLDDYRQKEASCEMPTMIINGTIINDGRKLLMSALPVSYLTRPEYSLQNTKRPPIDAVDFGAFFKSQKPYNLRLTTALRMNATFPYILPVVGLPSSPEMNIMDAGLRDNFGVEVAMRYAFVFRNWMQKNAGDVILLQIRDTKENDLFPQSAMGTLGNMLANPVFVIQNKWESFQSYYHGYIKDYANEIMPGKLHIINMEYIPEHAEKSAALNFHLTHREKLDLLKSIYHEQNVAAADSITKILNTH